MSLTPASRNAEATDDAFWEGAINGLLTLIPSGSAVYYAMKNSPGFVKRTNVQSRTAMVIMPALFAFGLTSELRLSNKMHEIAEQTRHTNRTVEWAEHKAAANSDSARQYYSNLPTHEMHLSQLYQQSVDQSGVRVVPGDTLGLHHKAANYLQANPIKVLASVAVPSIGYIFYGRSGQQHLDFSVKLLHTRVFGQFATISLLLSVMGFKEFMDRNGKFITEAERDGRVEEMKQVRLALLERLEEERQHKLDLQAELEKAHQEDVQAGKASHHKKAHPAKKRVPAASSDKPLVADALHATA